MVSRDALDFLLNIKNVTDRTGDGLQPVQAFVVDEVTGRVRLRFGAETDEEAGTQRYARAVGAPYAPGTEVMAQPIGRDWFVLGPVQRGTGTAPSSIEGTGALPGATVFDLLAVIAPSLRWQGTVRTMTPKQRALALRMARQFPGLLQVASGGRVGCRVRLVVQEDTWDLDAAITAGRADVATFATSGSWITDQGAQSLWATYGGLTYDSRMLFLGTGQMDSTVNEITRRDFPYSFINPEDTWYDSERAAGRVTDTMVHAFMRQIEDILRGHGVEPTSVDGYAAAGFGVDPIRGLVPWFQQWWRTADLSGLVDDARLPDIDARTSLVPFNRVDIDDSWGSLQTVAAASTGGGSGATTLDDLTDVDGATAATTGQILLRGSDGIWRPGAAPSSGGTAGNPILTIRDNAALVKSSPTEFNFRRGFDASPYGVGEGVDVDVTYAGSGGAFGVAETAARGDHGHLSTAVADLPEAVQDIVAALLTAGAGIVLTYNDTANTYTIAVNPDVTQNTTFRNVQVAGWDENNITRWFLNKFNFVINDATGQGFVVLSGSSASRFALAPTVGAAGTAVPVSIEGHVHALTGLSNVTDTTATTGHVLTRQAGGAYAFQAPPASGGGTAGTRDYPITYVSTATPTTPRTGDFWWDGADNRPTSDDPHASLIVAATAPSAPSVGNLWVQP